MSTDKEPSSDLTVSDDQSPPDEIASQETVPQETAQEVSGPVLEQLTSYYRYRAPLPPPEHFRAYDDVVPGGGDRLLAMAERNQDLAELRFKANMRKNEQIHEEWMTESHARFTLLGRAQWLVFSIVIVILVASTILAITVPNFQIAGMVNLVVVLVALIYHFLRGGFGDRKLRPPAERSDAERLPQIPESLERPRHDPDRPDSDATEARD